MQRFLMLLIVSAAVGSAHAVEIMSIPVEEIPAPEITSEATGQDNEKGSAGVVTSSAVYRALQQAEMLKHEAALAKLEQKRESMTELERLATEIRYSSPPSREEVLPYRFDDVTRLLSMLRDPQWSDRWRNIVATIGMAADKKGALKLMEFIKNGPLPEGYEAAASNTRLTGIAALAYTIVDQDIPEVLEFLQRLTDSEYVESLNMGPRAHVSAVRHRAYIALAAAATDESMAILEGYLRGAQAKKAKMSVQALSMGSPESSKSNESVEKDIRLLEQYLSWGKKRRAGLE